MAPQIFLHPCTRRAAKLIEDSVLELQLQMAVVAICSTYRGYKYKY